MPRDYTEEARTFHALNPQVYEMLRAKALQAVRRGQRRLGIRTLWESLRWDLMLQTTPVPGSKPSTDIKLNDHYTAFYARELMAREPELAGVFEVRGGSSANDDQAEPEQREIWEEAS
jgi:hypothetical protein